MNTADRIHEQVQHLPEPLQKAVLHFVEYLIRKPRREDDEWASLGDEAARRAWDE